MSRFVETATALLKKTVTYKSMFEVNSTLDALFSPSDRIRVVSFLNAHAVIRSCKDDKFRNALLSSEYLFRDGSGVAMLMRKMDLDPGLNLNGTDLIPEIINRLPRTKKIALLGTQELRLRQAEANIREIGFTKVLTADGFRPDHEYVNLIRHKLPSLVILAMGMPKQERVAKLLAQDPELQTRDIIVVNGGAILDFLSGEVPRAPRWMRRLGIEWLYRLLREPARMFPRFRDSFCFALHVLLMAAALRNAMNDGRGN